MTAQDRRRWDERYAQLGPAGAVNPPSFLAPHVDLIPAKGLALDIACGQGTGSVWLASRGLDVWGIDISAVAVEQAQELARRNHVGDRCRFDVVDLDQGLPPSPPANMILCNKFRDSRLDRALIERLAPGGLLAIAVLSEVGAAPGPFRAAPGELPSAFASLQLIAGDESDGHAWLLARR
ncbi:class I SAM-dependent methyltransferase [Mycobacterium asiaticum]|uniref:SAM-dependent methyltransferase n=1 Tax=Mycobacterium asiaticum TaxID=1790 RepID=A0A1A3CC11_MYCAS|nr:class I SAM-dependent methyltransferase [Mycobacterium asiaticum]OBI84515.1 SAM-dependent methyltransferase [Mycobacterium asiaticum]